MYKNEAAFSKAFTSQINSNNVYYTGYQRIETGSIGVGVPDLIMWGPASTGQWVELKNMPNAIYDEDAEYAIKWRRGQQSWAYEYLCDTNKNGVVVTVCALNEGFLIIPQLTMYTKGIVTRHNTTCFCREIRNIFNNIDFVATFKENI